jgi:ubiquitin carboxyl-terminal hydrolase 8
MMDKAQKLSNNKCNRLLETSRILTVIFYHRFYHDGWWRKRQTYVDFPFNLDMHHYSLVPDQRYTNYKLYGVSNHYGTMEGGHYTAYCKNECYDKWYKFDDHEVSEISNSDICSGAAYILFYTSMDYKHWNYS